MLTFNEESIVYSKNGSGNNHGLMHRCLRTGPTPSPSLDPLDLIQFFLKIILLMTYTPMYTFTAHNNVKKTF